MDPTDPQHVPEDGDLDTSDDAEAGEDESGSESSGSSYEDEYVYSQDEAVAAFSDYYAFLAKMYLDESSVMHPPPGGWDDIVDSDPAVLQSLGKTDEVLSLMARLPYIHYRGNWHDDADAVPDCSFEAWTDVFRRISAASDAQDMLERAKNHRFVTESPEFTDLAPPHVFAIAHRPYAEGVVIVLDTKLGLLQWDGCSCPYIVQWNGRGCTRVFDVDWDRVTASAQERHWRGSAQTWTIPDFFTNLKYLFTNLDWIPISPQTVISAHDTYAYEDGMLDMLKEIYRQHGWPDLAVYRKAECMAAVQKAMKENYPFFACSKRRD